MERLATSLGAPVVFGSINHLQLRLQVHPIPPEILLTSQNVSTAPWTAECFFARSRRHLAAKSWNFLSDRLFLVFLKELCVHVSMDVLVEP